MKWFIYRIILIWFYSTTCAAKKVSYTIVPERFELSSDPEYFKDYKQIIFPGANGIYYVNQSAEVLIQWPEDVSIRITIVQLKKDGRFVQFGKPIVGSVCNMLANDRILYPSIRKTSNFPEKCPIKTGKYSLNNYQVPIDTLPPILIRAKGYAKVEIVIDDTPILAFIAHGRIDKTVS